MKNITITLDEKVAAWVRIFAAQRGNRGNGRICGVHFLAPSTIKRESSLGFTRVVDPAFDITAWMRSR